MGNDLGSVFKSHRIMGLFPFDDRFQWSKKWLMYCVFIQLLSLPPLIIGFYFHYQTIVYIPIRSMRVLTVQSCLLNLLGLFGNVLTVIQLTTKREVVFHLLDSIDKEIVGCRDFPKKSFYASLNIFWCIFMIITWTTFMDTDFVQENLTLSIMGFLSSTSTLSITSQLWDLMRALNILLREITKEYDEGSIIALERVSTYGDYINEIYGPLLFITAVKSFFEVVFQSYLFLLPAFPDQLKVNIMLLFFIVFSFCRMGAIIYSFNRFLDQVQWFNDSLHWKMLNDNTGRYSKNEMMFFHYIAYKKTKFSAGGFFDIDYTLIGTMISVCTTYLVIVLQYGQG